MQATVAVGAAVAAGTVLGHLQTGLSHCFPRSCLHWGLLRGAEYLDPLSLLGAAPVRLLPLDAPLLLMPWGAPAGTPLGAALP